ncbi:hypothetical protein ACLOJK_008943 [Asimina triloba]
MVVSHLPSPLVPAPAPAPARPLPSLPVSPSPCLSFAARPHTPLPLHLPASPSFFARPRSPPLSPARPLPSLPVSPSPCLSFAARPHTPLPLHLPASHSFSASPRPPPLSPARPLPSLPVSPSPCLSFAARPHTLLPLHLPASPSFSARPSPPEFPMFVTRERAKKATQSHFKMICWFCIVGFKAVSMLVLLYRGTHQFVHRSCLDHRRSVKEGFAFSHCTTCKAQFHLQVESLEDNAIATLVAFAYFMDKDGRYTMYGTPPEHGAPVWCSIIFPNPAITTDGHQRRSQQAATPTAGDSVHAHEPPDNNPSSPIRRRPSLTRADHDPSPRPEHRPFRPTPTVTAPPRSTTPAPVAPASAVRSKQLRPFIQHFDPMPRRTDLADDSQRSIHHPPPHAKQRPDLAMARARGLIPSAHHAVHASHRPLPATVDQRPSSSHAPWPTHNSIHTERGGRLEGHHGQAREKASQHGRFGEIRYYICYSLRPVLLRRVKLALIK